MARDEHVALGLALTEVAFLLKPGQPVTVPARLPDCVFGCQERIARDERVLQHEIGRAYNRDSSACRALMRVSDGGRERLQVGLRLCGGEGRQIVVLRNNDGQGI
jgi:hypothetical protein